MDKFIYDECNGLWYELCGDYFLPCVTVPKRKPVGIWGRRYRKYLKEHRNPVYTAMLLAGTMEDRVAEVYRQAEEMLDRLIEQMAEREGITEQLKDNNQMAWGKAMNSIQNRAMEMVNNDIILGYAHERCSADPSQPWDDPSDPWHIQASPKIVTE